MFHDTYSEVYKSFKDAGEGKDPLQHVGEYVCLMGANVVLQQKQLAKVELAFCNIAERFNKIIEIAMEARNKPQNFDMPPPSGSDIKEDVAQANREAMRVVEND